MVAERDNTVVSKRPGSSFLVREVRDLIECYVTLAFVSCITYKS